MAVKEIRLVIGIPSRDTWLAQFGMSMLFLTNQLAAKGNVGRSMVMRYRIHNKRGSILGSMRQSIVDTAIKHDSTHLLFIDSDQTFPSDLAHRLLAHEKEVIGCNIATKTIPANPTARAFSKAGKPEGEFVMSDVNSPPLERVWRLGTGIMLIDLSIFKKYHKLQRRPWFDQPWQKECDAYMGEDWYFCKRLREAGVDIWVDHKLSLEIGHVGSFNYGHDLVIPIEAREKLLPMLDEMEAQDEQVL